jgi:hypothetical protein
MFNFGVRLLGRMKEIARSLTFFPTFYPWGVALEFRVNVPPDKQHRITEIFAEEAGPEDFQSLKEEIRAIDKRKAAAEEKKAVKKTVKGKKK